jgi:hypothetical protein
VDTLVVLLIQPDDHLCPTSTSFWEVIAPKSLVLPMSAQRYGFQTLVGWMHTGSRFLGKYWHGDGEMEFLAVRDSRNCIEVAAERGARPVLASDGHGKRQSFAGSKYAESI